MGEQTVEAQEAAEAAAEQAAEASPYGEEAEGIAHAALSLAEETSPRVEPSPPSEPTGAAAATASPSTLEIMNSVVSRLVEEHDEVIICQITGAAIQSLLPGAKVVVSRYVPDIDSMEVVALLGLGTQAEAVRKLLRIDPHKMQFPLSEATPEELALYRDGRLHYMEDGLHAVAMRTIRKPVCRAIERMLGIVEVHTMGLAWKGRHYGGLILGIPARLDLEQYREPIETMVRQASIAMQRSASERSLATSEAQLRTLVDAMDDALYVVDADLRIVAANKTFKQWLALRGSDGDPVGRLVNEAFVRLPPRLERELRQVFESGVATEEEVVEEVGGQATVEEVRRLPIRAGDEVTHVLSVTRDVTERRAAAERERAHLASMSTVASVSARLLAETSSEAIGRVVAEGVAELLPEACLVAGTVTADGARLNVEPVAGLQPYKKMLEALVGFDPFSRSYAYADMPPDALRFFQSGKLERLEGGFSEIAAIAGLRAVDGKAVEDLLGAEEVWAIGFAWSGRHNGGLLIALPRGTSLGEHAETIGTLARQASVALQRAVALEDTRAGEQRLERALRATADAMGSVVETRDPYTAGHERRVAALGEAIALQMGLDENTATGVRVAGSMHDVGKIGVPAEILSKPARLNELERELVRHHSQIGHDILSNIEFEWPLAEIVLQHHERLDGSGYPRGLSGTAICVEACILAVADVVEAMSFDRPYRPALGADVALEEIRQGRGRLYAPAAVDACLALMEKGDFTFPE